MVVFTQQVRRTAELFSGRCRPSAGAGGAGAEQWLRRRVRGPLGSRLADTERCGRDAPVSRDARRRAARLGQGSLQPGVPRPGAGRRAGRRPGLTPIRAILARNPGIVLDAATRRYAAFEGGSEPGVLCLTWLLERRDGRVFALALVLNDPGRGIDEAAAVALAEGAVQLLGEVP